MSRCGLLCKNIFVMNILLIGGGGREHAMAKRIVKSTLCDKLFIAPGNAGTAQCGTNVSLDIGNFHEVGDFAEAHSVHMVVVGPESPLVNGMCDHFSGKDSLKHVLFVGPCSRGAMLEGSKDFAKGFMNRNGIPTAAYRSFTRDTFDEALDFLDTLNAPYVLKADGLAAGKGVLICSTREEAVEGLEEMLHRERFGKASQTVVIEEFLKGREMSVFVITDGKDYRILPAAKDYKRIGDKDTGANTGGMGAVSPVPFAGKKLMSRIEERIIKPTIRGIQKEGMVYRGFIFFGLMICGDDPFVIEYNVRLGDPEAEVILPRIESDFTALLKAVAEDSAGSAELKTAPGYALCVMLASGGYPSEFDKGFEIRGIAEVSESELFFAGVESSGDRLLTAGGRVMAVTARAGNLRDAREKAYHDARVIDYKGKYYRRDIGLDLIPFL